KAPTPGLQAKYRESLAEITTAFETLTLAADSSSLPVLKKESGDRSQETGGSASPRAGSPGGASLDDSRTSARPQATAGKKKSSSKEFALVAVIAVAVLGAGGWFVMKTRTENAEAAQAAKTEADRLAALKTSLRSKLAEVRVDWEAHESDLQDAERRANELKSELRGLREAPAMKKAELSAQVTAHELYAKWLKSHLLRHPAKLARVRAEELLQAGAPDEASTVMGEITAALKELAEDITYRRQYFFETSTSLRLHSKPEGVLWLLTDAYGRTREGTTPAQLEDLPLTHLVTSGVPVAPFGGVEQRGELTTGTISVRFFRPGWPEVVRNTTALLDDNPVLEAEFPEGSVDVTSQPAGVPFTASNALGWSATGKTPATLQAVPPGPVTVKLSRPGYQDVSGEVKVVAGKSTPLALDQRTQEVSITVAESNVAIFVDDKSVGPKAASLTDLPPGEHALRLETKGYRPYRTKFVVRQEGTKLNLSYSFNQLIAETITCTACQGAGRLQHQQTCNQCRGSTKVDCPSCKNGIAAYDADGKWIMCSYCNRKGTLPCESCTGGIQRWQTTCTTCSGDGKVSQLQLSP
ncbi:MAG: PEGA domain-containing protein, partial [Candidatus Didemnitutus sp.]|nr:PEGA domain-containing protein [Candidatus Didemnitutus sp.]